MSIKKLELPALSGVGIVVKDIDKAGEYYSETFGIGPFKTIFTGVIANSAPSTIP